jgi:hypothetical protein
MQYTKRTVAEMKDLLEELAGTRGRREKDVEYEALFKDGRWWTVDQHYHARKQVRLSYIGTNTFPEELQFIDPKHAVNGMPFVLLAEAYGLDAAHMKANAVEILILKEWERQARAKRDKKLAVLTVVGVVAAFAGILVAVWIGAFP